MSNHENLIREFSSYLLDKLEKARKNDPNPESIVSTSHEAIKEAVETIQYFQRSPRNSELWLIHQYLNWLEAKTLNQSF